MPYRWSSDPTHIAAPETSAADPMLRLDLWPHRSLSNKGFEWTIWLMFVGAMIPLLSFIGSSAFWVLLAFALMALAALWFGLRRSDRDRLREEMLIWSDRVELTHCPANGGIKTWQANPYWIKLTQHDEVRGIEAYLTLRGGAADQDREVELGAFLSPEERKTLCGELSTLLGTLKKHHGH